MGRDAESFGFSIPFPTSFPWHKYGPPTSKPCKIPRYSGGFKFAWLVRWRNILVLSRFYAAPLITYCEAEETSHERRQDG